MSEYQERAKNLSEQYLKISANDLELSRLYEIKGDQYQSDYYRASAAYNLERHYFYACEAVKK
jgi:hypothetical protein